MGQDSYDLRGRALAKAKDGLPMTAAERAELNRIGDENRRFQAMGQQKDDKSKSQGDAAIKGLQAAAARQAEKDKQPQPPPPDELPENPGIGDYYRVGVSRIKRAFFGPPAPPAKDEKKK